MFGAEFWEERYRSHEAVWSRAANPQLVAETSDLPSGTALDVGRGEGADALWLAQRGWQVTASSDRIRDGAVVLSTQYVTLAGIDLRVFHGDSHVRREHTSIVPARERSVHVSTPPRAC